MTKRSLSLLAVATAIALAALSGGTAAAAPKPSGGGNSWSSATPISSVNQPDPTRGAQLNDVAVNASGLTIAAWDQFTYNNGGGATIGAAVQSGGRWGAPFTISNEPGFSMTPKVAVGADGTMAVSWINQVTDPVTGAQTDRVRVATKLTTSSTWSTATVAMFTNGGVAITRMAPVAVDAAGNVTAVWNVWDGVRNTVQSATMLQGKSWSAPTTLSGTTTDGLYLSLAVNARGDAAVAYTLSPYSSYLSGTWAEYTFRSGPTGAWTNPVRVSEILSSSVGYITDPQVALDASGRATIIYMGNGLEATRQLATGSWTSTPNPIVTANAVSSFISPDLGIDANGNAVVAVSIFDATINVDRASVWVATGSADGVWKPAVRITDPSVPVDAYATRVAVSPDGTLALVGWIDHYHGVVQVSRLVNNTWSAATTIGRGTAFSSFQEMLGLDAASSSVARAIWKNTKTGTQTMATNFKG